MWGMEKGVVLAGGRVGVLWVLWGVVGCCGVLWRGEWEGCLL